MVKFELPRGMRDIESDEFANISYIREKFIQTAQSFNFQLAEPSPLELLSTLEAKSGASISNEIYAFKDKAERDIALRFDLTIGLTRYIASRRDLKMPAKLAAFAGVWRYDEPQAGRYRYFHQWDIEVYGPFSQESDAEVIEFVHMFFKRLGLRVTIDVNDRQLLEEYIRTKLGVTTQNEISEMFRAVDKVPKKGIQAVMSEYKDKIEPARLQELLELSKQRGTIEEVSKVNLSDLQSWKQLAGLMDSLKSRKVEGARVNFGIVRGLDYYSGMVFEAFDPSSDSGALVGGGRYDRLTEAFGRRDVGATGAAGGVERIIMALGRNGVLKKPSRTLVFVAHSGEELARKAVEIVSTLRHNGISADYDILGRALRKQLEDASTKGAEYVIIVAPEEVNTDQVIIRSMHDGSERKCRIDDLVDTIRGLPRVESLPRSSS